jgi:hypothetical protein
MSAMDAAPAARLSSLGTVTLVETEMDAAPAARLSSLGAVIFAETDLLPRTRARIPPSIVFVVESDSDNYDSAASIVLSRIPWSALEIRTSYVGRRVSLSH